MFADEYFDPDMKRFVSIEDMWVRNAKNTLRCAADVKRRVVDLKELRQALQETVSVLALREQQTIQSIQEEAERLVMQIRRRESELVSCVTADISIQREQLDTIMARVDEHSETLRREVQIMMNTPVTVAAPQEEAGNSSPSNDDERRSESPTSRGATVPNGISFKSRFAALSVCEKALKQSCYFAIPETFSFNVVSKQISADAYLSLTRSKCGTLIPTALTIAAKENKFVCPLPSLSSRGAAGRAAAAGDGSPSVASSNMLQSVSRTDATLVPRCNPLGLPLGIFHYLATQGGRESFKNPIEIDVVRASCSIPIQVGTLAGLLYDRTLPTVDGVLPAAAAGGFRTRNVPNGRIVFDFSDRRRVRLSAYVLQHGHHEEHAALRSWRVEGSNDGNEWIPLDEQRECRMLGCKPFNEATFVISPLVTASGYQSTMKHRASLAAISSASSPGAAMSSPQQQAAGSANASQALTNTNVSSTGKTVVAAASEEDLPAFRYLSLLSIGPNAAGSELHHIELARVEFFGTVIVG